MMQRNPAWPAAAIAMPKLATSENVLAIPVFCFPLSTQNNRTKAEPDFYGGI